MIKNTYKFIAIALMALVMPVFAMASSGTPRLVLDGVTRVYTNKVVIIMTYDPNNASYGYNESPITYVEYTNIDTGERLVSYTNTESSVKLTHTIALYNLDSNTEYEYRGIMKYDGETIKTPIKSFKTPGASRYTGTSTDSQTTNNPSTVYTNTSNTSSTSTIVNIPKVVTDITTSAKSSVMTGGGNYKNGVGLSITNEQARTSVDDTFTYTIKYQNTNSTSLQNTELVIQLPERYEFVKSSVDMDYNEKDNTVSYTIGRITPRTLKTVTFTARAIGDGKGEVSTTATLFYEGGSISATDRDAFNGGSKSVLGASVFGAGFFPQTLAGWIAIILLIAAIIIVARRYMVAAPKPVVYVQHPPQPQPQK